MACTREYKELNPKTPIYCWEIEEQKVVEFEHMVIVEKIENMFHLREQNSHSGPEHTDTEALPHL